ncbi:arginase family protein [Denitrobaculum tricleocarpae]|uniref:Agmatinase n=1 Tax=Denitrobaculum tricleocarpae TaxID=2591009 RepID=A0A545TXM7_9PROT|nr:arginase family protein [Denitrobaculum tricleocarpae]TQV81973.1 agmatinase [Denitrobaculum tricleocarpae]
MTDTENLLQPTHGFMAVPNSLDLSGAKAAVLGLPFDCGTNQVRIGARHGPAAIRQQSLALDRRLFGFSERDAVAELGLVDCGDAAVTSGRIEPSFEAMEQATAHILRAGAVPVTFGGDGAVTLPQLRAMKAVHKNLAVLHFDAHTDAYPIGDERHNTATTFTCAAEEGLIDTRASFHIGCRGPVSQKGLAEFSQGLGYRIVDMEALARDGRAHMAAIREELAGRPVYICWDMDFFDASCAPGVCEPTWGGPTAYEGLALLRALAGLKIVGVDINTVCPPLDPGNMTAHLAATVALNALHVIAIGRGG